MAYQINALWHLRSAKTVLGLPQGTAYDATMAVLNAHFDGKVIVPDEPTGLIAGTRLRVTVETVGHARSAADCSDEDDALVAGSMSAAVAALPPEDFRDWEK